MSFLTNVEVFHKPEVGYFVLKTSRFNIFKKITGRPGDLVGGDWSYRGAIITVSGKHKD